MAKEKPAELEPLEEQIVYFIKQRDKFPFRGQWEIYSKTKYGDKCFNTYHSRDDAIGAAKYHRLTLLLTEEAVE